MYNNSHCLCNVVHLFFFKVLTDWLGGDRKVIGNWAEIGTAHLMAISTSTWYVLLEDEKKAKWAPVYCYSNH